MMVHKTRNKHVRDQIPDYVLGLLSRADLRRVERHTAVCAHCRHALQAERQVGAMVKATLHIATHPDPARLKQLAPPAPTRRLTWVTGLLDGGRQQIALAGLVLVLLLGGLGFYCTQQTAVWTNPTATLAATATSTDAPTVTMVTASGQNAGAVTAVPRVLDSRSNIVATPAPNPTPIAALLRN